MNVTGYGQLLFGIAWIVCWVIGTLIAFAGGCYK
jgi:hypothetical protein